MKICFSFIAAVFTSRESIKKLCGHCGLPALNKGCKMFLLLFNIDFNADTPIVYRSFARFNVKISGLGCKTNDPSTSQKISRLPIVA